MEDKEKTELGSNSSLRLLLVVDVINYSSQMSLPFISSKQVSIFLISQLGKLWTILPRVHNTNGEYQHNTVQMENIN